jgi:hypothetical protein
VPTTLKDLGGIELSKGTTSKKYSHLMNTDLLILLRKRGRDRGEEEVEVEEEQERKEARE